MERRPPLARSVDDHDGIALLDEPLPPARTAVGCRQPFGPLEAATVDEHDRPWMADLFRRFPLREQRSALVGLAFHLDAVTRYPELTLPNCARRIGFPERGRGLVTHR